MSDGAFRDDQEAALARADALEDELARAQRENAALRDKLDGRAAPAPKQRSRSMWAETGTADNAAVDTLAEGAPREARDRRRLGYSGFKNDLLRRLDSDQVIP